MASIQFPPNLPKPTIDAYSYKPQSTNVSTEFEAGPRRVRNRYRTPTYDFSLRWVLHVDELGIFEYFMKEVSNWGSIWFDLTLLFGTGLKRIEARVPSGTYDTSVISGEYLAVTMNVEGRDIPYIAEAAYIAATQNLFYNGAETFNGVETFDGYKG